MTASKVFDLNKWIGLILPMLLYCFADASAQAYRGFRVGHYEGPVYNKTGNSFGRAQFDILSTAANGVVRVHLREYAGLEGEGDLSGIINTGSVMQVSGKLVSPSDGAAWQAATFAVMQNDHLWFTHKLTLEGQLQEEMGTMTYKGPATPAFQLSPTAKTDGGVPTGIYLHPSYHETAAWYFSPDGRVWRHLSEGFTQTGLAAEDAALRGTYRLNGTKFTMTNANNYSVDFSYRVNNGQLFLNDLPLERVLSVANPQLLVGEYIHSGGNSSLQTANTLSLRANGTYTRGSIGAYKADDGGRHSGSSDETGTWQYADHTLTFRAQNGTITQKIALLPPKGSMTSSMGALYLGGKLYRRK